MSGLNKGADQRGNIFICFDLPYKGDDRHVRANAEEPARLGGIAISPIGIPVMAMRNHRSWLELQRGIRLQSGIHTRIAKVDGGINQRDE